MEIQNLDKLIEKYKLPKEEHHKILESLKKDLFGDRMSEKNPSLMFVIGQPGCGKTTFINSTNLSQYVMINSDDYRSFSKYSKEILEQYPTNYARLTNYDAHLWGDELFSYAIENGYSVLREKAPTDCSLLECLKKVPNHYKVVINVVVAGNLTSLLATRERYEKEILQNDKAKLSNIDTHDKCYHLLPNFILDCHRLGVKVNYIVPIDYHYQIIPVGSDALNLLQEIREESNQKSCLTYDERMSHIRMNMINRNAPKEQFDELIKIERLYSKIINYDDNDKKRKV